MRRHPTAALLSLAVPAVLAACAERDVRRLDPTPAPVDTWSIPITANRALDILFVVDDSRSMAGEQASLAANFPAFVGVLQTIQGGLPDVHLGVVSSNVGAAGMAGIDGCAGDGDDGALLVREGCTGLTGRFISDVADERGGRLRNYTGELDDLFACMAQLGTRGCGFEMHLESMYRALQPGRNPGFLRPDAYLAVIYVEAKQYSGATANIAKAAKQVWSTLTRLKASPAGSEIRDAYCLIFRLGGDAPIYELPTEPILCAHFRVYFMLIDIAPASEAGSQEKKAAVVLTEADLLPPQAPEPPEPEG
jgi:hypothetical protein